MDRQQTGAWGEQLAAQAYAGQGYKLLAHNYRTRLGEIDLILQKDQWLVFCEVKTRKAGAPVSGAEAVDTRKQRRVIAAAKGYLAQKKLSDPFMRFDVAEVTTTEEKPPVVRIIENAFSL